MSLDVASPSSRPSFPALALFISLTLLACFSSFSLEAIDTQGKWPPTVVFMSDFGTLDDSVAICKGAMLGIEPNLRIIDITHDVQPFSILDGARFLAGTTPYYPSGIVFIAVVDPGVGSSRKPIVVKSKRGQYFVLPDNGLISMVLQEDGFDAAREITNTAFMIGKNLSSTFHGRDIFAPVAAHLARGEDWTTVGPTLNQLVKLPIAKAKREEQGIAGEVVALDGPYGNLITNIPAEEFKKLNFSMGENVLATIGEMRLALRFVKTFSDVPEKQPLLYIDSRGRLGVAVNQASFADLYKIKPPIPIFIFVKETAEIERH